MAFGELFGEERERAETSFALHRAATSSGEIGRVKQTISESTLVSKNDERESISFSKQMSYSFFFIHVYECMYICLNAITVFHFFWE